jgi:hypothetical protein
MIGIGNACSMEQEFIVTTKTKKKYVSEQQDLEMDGDITASNPKVVGIIADFLKMVSAIADSSANRIYAHMDGKKSSLDKVERTECYALKKEIQRELSDFIKEMEKRLQRLKDLFERLIVLLNQKIQSE